MGQIRLNLKGIFVEERFQKWIGHQLIQISTSFIQLSFPTVYLENSNGDGIDFKEII